MLRIQTYVLMQPARPSALLHSTRSPLTAVERLTTVPYQSIDNPLDYGTTYNSPYNGPNFSLNPAYQTAKLYNNLPAGYGPNSLYQNNIKTSTRINYEEGLDFKFLKNRLGLSLTAYPIH